MEHSKKRKSVSDIVGNTMPLFSVVCVTHINEFVDKEECFIALYQGDRYEAQEYYLREILKSKTISETEINEFIKELNNTVIAKYYSTMWKRYNVLVIARECAKTEKLWSIEQTTDKRLRIDPHYATFMKDKR